MHAFMDAYNTRPFVISIQIFQDVPYEYAEQPRNALLISSRVSHVLIRSAGPAVGSHRRLTLQRVAAIGVDSRFKKCVGDLTLLAEYAISSVSATHCICR